MGSSPKLLFFVDLDDFYVLVVKFPVLLGSPAFFGYEGVSLLLRCIFVLGSDGELAALLTGASHNDGQIKRKLTAKDAKSTKVRQT